MSHRAPQPRAGEEATQGRQGHRAGISAWEPHEGPHGPGKGQRGLCPSNREGQTSAAVSPGDQQLLPHVLAPRLPHPRGRQAPGTRPSAAQLRGRMPTGLGLVPPGRATGTGHTRAKRSTAALYWVLGFLAPCPERAARRTFPGVT